MPLLKIRNLSVALTKNGVPTHLVRELNYSIEAGETLAIVGESGSGKSISALALIGLTPKELIIEADELIFDGHDLLSISREQMRQLRGSGIAMVFQEPMTSLNPVRSIGSQITEGIIENLGHSKAAARQLAIDLLAEVGIADGERRLKQYPHHFSGGMRQRVMIAIALSANPKLIIADEPTTALDVTIQAQILDLMARLCRDHGTALILITHNLGIVARYAARVNVMYGGQIIETGSAAEIYSNPQHPYTEGLLRSVPRLDQDRSVPLMPIEGTPADAFTLIDGCRFHPRCPYAANQCRNLRPQMQSGVACHFPLTQQERVAS